MAAPGAIIDDTNCSTSDMILKDHASAIIAVNQKLKALGIDSTIRLPQICVIGDQSAGKSSLIEAISNIQVPKADGTCTRCPVSINLSSGTPSDSAWKCTVLMEERYDYIPNRKLSAAHPLGPWEKRIDMNVVELETTRDKSRVAALITQAQEKILQSASSKHSTLRASAGRRTTKKNVLFSPNVVRLDISEGIRPNLCFIDLPGVITNTPQWDDRYLIDLVSNLVKDYASDARNENILALPMPVDVQTSRACSIIQELQVEDRTLAVFTKPDCVPESRQKLFIDQYLKKNEDHADSQDGENTRFQAGCFFVMLNNSSAEQSEPLISESNFFDKALWAELQPLYSDHLGVPALREHLRSQLFYKTVESLPDNMSAIQVELTRIEKDLKQLPPPPDKLFFHVKMQQILSTFTKDMRDKFCGDTEKCAKGPLRGKFEGFAVRINDAKPTVDHGSNDEIRDMVALVEEIDKLLADKKPPKIQEPYDGGEAEKSSGKNFSLAQLEKINHDFSICGVPGDVDPRAVTKACQRSVNSWRLVLDGFLSEVANFLQKEAMLVFQDSFDQYKNLGIYPVVQQWIIEYVSTAVDSERKIAEANCLAERSTPFTLDERQLMKLKVTAEKNLTEKRYQFRLELAKKRKDLDEGVYKKDRKDISWEDLGLDKHKSDITLGAKTQAYYEIASKRFVDSICQGVFSRLLPACGEALAADLSRHIDASNTENSDIILQWMIEDPAKENTRKALCRKKEHLFQGRKDIEAVLGGTITSNLPPMKRSSMAQNTDTVPESPTKKTKLAHRATSHEEPLPETRPTDTKDVEMDD